MSRYTVFAQAANNYTEEVDVDARDSVEAAALAGVELARDYEPGWKIVAVEQRFGLYL
jgi:hypothetical protein